MVLLNCSFVDTSNKEPGEKIVWAVPQLSIMIIYNSTLSILIQ